MQMLDPKSNDILAGCPPMQYRQPSTTGHPVRFLLISHPRSGTMMLANMLEKHPAVRLHNLYAVEPGERAAQYHYNWVLYQWQECPEGVTHLGTTMHRVGAGWIKQCTSFPPSRYWAMVADAHDRYICLHRENLLRQYLSRKVGVALKTYDVLKPRSAKPVPQPLVLELGDLVEYVTTMDWLRADTDRHFRSRLPLTYEQLSSDWRSTFRQVQAYLGLPERDIAPITYRQEDRPLRKAIKNYDEVAACLDERGWGEWLHE